MRGTGWAVGGETIATEGAGGVIRATWSAEVEAEVVSAARGAEGEVGVIVAARGGGEVVGVVGRAGGPPEEAVELSASATQAVKPFGGSV
jgi:hypothetical protein